MCEIDDATLAELDDDLMDLMGKYYWTVGPEILLDQLKEMIIWWEDPDLDDMTGFICMDCKIQTDEINEYYMINEDLWYLINPDINGMLCIGCVEQRLDRKLTSIDFTDAPINTNPKYRRSLRLQNRLQSI